jgi:hypothetical protein
MANETDEVVNRLLAMSLTQQAQIEILLTLVEEIGRKNGVSEIDGLSIREWFQKTKLAAVDRMLIEEEDKNPAVAAFLQKIMDESDRRLGGK